MLVLSRKQGERIVLGDSIIVMVVAIEGGRVRLGVQAPPDVPVFREEVWNQPHLFRPPPPVRPAPKG